MGGIARWACVLALCAGCATEQQQPQPTVLVDGQPFTLASAIAIDESSAAVLNVETNACGAFYEDARDLIDGEAPMLLGAFAQGPSGVLVIDDDDPRTYVTVATPGDAVTLIDGILDVRLSFSSVVRQVRIGVDWYIDVQTLDEPIVVEQQFATLECDE